MHKKRNYEPQDLTCCHTHFAARGLDVTHRLEVKLYPLIPKQIANNWFHCALCTSGTTEFRVNVDHTKRRFYKPSGFDSITYSFGPLEDAQVIPCPSLCRIQAGAQILFFGFAFWLFCLQWHSQTQTLSEQMQTIIMLSRIEFVWSFSRRKYSLKPIHFPKELGLL